MAPIALDWLHIVVLLGAIQGFLLTAVLAAQRRNRTANRLLAVAMFAFSIYMLSAVYNAAGYVRVFPFFFGVAYPLPFIYGPLVYLYAVCASDRDRGLHGPDALHFLPFIAVVMAGLPIYLMSGAEKAAFQQQLLQGIEPGFMRFADPLKYVSGISYATATFLFLRRHRARVKDSYSSLERVNLQWLLHLAVATAAIWLLATMPVLLTQLWHRFPRLADDAVSLALAILVYGIGYRALRQPEIFNFAALDYRVHTGAFPVPPPATPAAPSAASGAPTPPIPPAAPPAGEATARYERSGLTEKEAAALKNALLAAMNTDRPYTNSDLTLADLAERLETTPHKLSEVLNTQLAQSFYDFVNGYRVQDVQRRIADERSKNLTILALAIDAGFASKSTFNQVFKKHTGQTPSAYRRARSR